MSSSSSSSSDSSSSSSSDSSDDESYDPYVASIFTEAMQLREKAQNNNHKALADVYLMIAAADEFDTLKPNYMQLCNLLFLNMLLIEAKRSYKQTTEPEKRADLKKDYVRLKKRELKMRLIVREKL